MRNLKGISIAVGILGVWAMHLSALLRWGTTELPTAAWPPAIALQTFLHTGLFITAHDAMHGTISPGRSKLNDILGRLAVGLYALFSYDKLIRKHRLHHDHPTDEADPDHHDGEQERFWPWYFGFLREYVGGWQLAAMALAFNVFHHGLGIEQAALLAFWVLPSIASTLQLFYFGTYLPHRQPEGGHGNGHCSSSNDFSPLLSFLSCYHFGYHREHHERPDVPWWRLPELRRQLD